MTAPTINRLFSRRITRTLLTPHPVEHYIRSLGVTWSDDSTGATVVSVDRPVPDVTVLTLRLPAGVDRPAERVRRSPKGLLELTLGEVVGVRGGERHRYSFDGRLNPYPSSLR